MKTVKQSFKILPEMENKVNQIGLRSRICYLSEPASGGDETGFVKGIIKHGHNSCLEMAAITLHVKHDCLCPLSLFHDKQYKYLTITYKPGLILISGSLRAFREVCMISDLMDNPIIDCCGKYLLQNYPLLFQDVYVGDGNLWEYQITRYDWETNPNNYSKGLRRLHQWAAVEFNTNRAVSHEIVRHRSCGLLQESQRYCAYIKDKFGNEVTFIEPTAFDFDKEEYEFWKNNCKYSESIYLWMLDRGKSAQAARTVLPNSCRTRIIVYTNLREWEHIFALRISKYAEPSMVEAMVPVRDKFREMFPGMFYNCQRSVA